MATLSNKIDVSNNENTDRDFIRTPHSGMGQAVAERTVLRPKGYWINSVYYTLTSDNKAELDLLVTKAKEEKQIVKVDWETWGDVADRVALGNSLLCNNKEEQENEYKSLKHHVGKATLLMSGRHLQHGDASQPSRTMEVFTNCSTSSTSFLLFYLLLNGCFRKGTKVKMADGSYKPIEEVRAGDIVVSFDEKTKQFVNQKVLRLNENQPKPMVKVRLENGEEIICTADHKFLTEDGEWVEAQHLAGKNVKHQSNNDWKDVK